MHHCTSRSQKSFEQLENTKKAKQRQKREEKKAVTDRQTNRQAGRRARTRGYVHKNTTAKRHSWFLVPFFSFFIFLVGERARKGKKGDHLYLYDLKEREKKSGIPDGRRIKIRRRANANANAKDGVGTVRMSFFFRKKEKKRKEKKNGDGGRGVDVGPSSRRTEQNRHPPSI